MMKTKGLRGKSVALAAAAIMAASVSMPMAAIYDPNATELPSEGAHVLIVPTMISAGPALIVNGVVLNDAPAVYQNEDGVWMLPMRAVAEGIGYTVTYRPEIAGADVQKDNQFTTIYFNRNSYFFNRVAPFELEAAPIVHNGVTFVPLSFFERVLQQEVVASQEELIIGKDTRPIVLEETLAETFTIELAENASTGYTWSYTIEPEAGITLVSNEYAEAEQDEDADDELQPVGAAGTRTWTFSADELGTYMMTFTYARAASEDAEAEAANVLTYSVTVVESEADEAVTEAE